MDTIETVAAPTDGLTVPERMQRLLAAQRAAFNAELPVSAAVRKDRIRRLMAMVEDHIDEVARTLSEDFGHRSREQSLLTEGVSLIRQAKHALQHMDRWMRVEKRDVGLPLYLMGARAWIEYQPKGVVGVISPWNFPVQLALAPVIAAFTAGNRAMVKASEITPATSALFERLAAHYFDATELVFICGGPDVGQAFASLAFDHLIFTGATSIARHILHAAADNLMPVTLELGGKSPTILGKGANIETATLRIATGKMMNAGQICLAPDYLMVPADSEEAVVGGLTRAVTDMYPNLRANPDYTTVVNDRHFARLQAWLDDARAKGARVIEVDPGKATTGNANNRRMPLSIVLDPTDDMTVMQEEIFGPILPVRRYQSIDEVIDYVNAHPRPLGLYYFGPDEAERRRLLDRTISGGVTLDDVTQHAGIEDLPFGGIGASGMGAYHGIDGFRTFSHAKAVYRQTKIDLAKLVGMRPPYGPKLLKTIRRELPNIK